MEIFFRAFYSSMYVFKMAASVDSWFSAADAPRSPSAVISIFHARTFSFRGLREDWLWHFLINGGFEGSFSANELNKCFVFLYLTEDSDLGLVFIHLSGFVGAFSENNQPNISQCLLWGFFALIFCRWAGLDLFAECLSVSTHTHTPT